MVSTVLVQAITSCTKGISKTSANPIPPEPVICRETGVSLITSLPSVNILFVAFFTSEKCRSYFAKIVSFFSFKMTNLTVVEPTSIPAFNFIWIILFLYNSLLINLQPV